MSVLNVHTYVLFSFSEHCRRGFLLHVWYSKARMYCKSVAIEKPEASQTAQERSHRVVQVHTSREVRTLNASPSPQQSIASTPG